MADTTLDEDLQIFNLAEDEAVENAELDSRIIRLADDEAQEKANEPSFMEKVGDFFVQAGRGALKAYTWPLDLLKLGMIGEGLSDLDELEETFAKAGKPFDRQDYIRSVFEQSQYIPSQELLEKSFEDVTGINITKPKSEPAKAIKQGAELFSFAPGKGINKLASAATGVATTQGLKAAGVGENKAEIIGDIASIGPQLVEKTATKIPQAAQKAQKTATQHSLPFLEFMVKEREPALKGRLLKNTEKRLQNEFHLTAKDALNKIVRNEIPIKRLRERGVNLDALAEHAYQVTESLARKHPKKLNTDQIVKNIDSEILRIQQLAPSPSDSQKAAIGLLEKERDILKIEKPTSEQLINQHKNYNADMKAIYKKPEFSGKEEQVRKTYEFLKNELVDTIEHQDSPDIANAFKAANKIYHEKQKLTQTESLLAKAFPGDTYNPKMLDKLLASKQGNFLRRNIGESAIKDLEDIAQYGKEAEQRMAKFIDLRSPAVLEEVKQWGQLAPFVFLPHNLQAALLGLAKYTSRHVQGKLLTRPALRETYKLTLKHAAEGSFNLLKKDFANIEKEIAKEWGSVDAFMDDVMSELPIYESN